MLSIEDTKTTESPPVDTTTSGSSSGYPIPESACGFDLILEEKEFFSFYHLQIMLDVLIILLWYSSY